MEQLIYTFRKCCGLLLCNPMPRSREEIVGDMLAAAVERIGKTGIMYRANLNYPQLQEYLGYLQDKKMITRHGGQYVVTEKGRRYLFAYKEMAKLIAD